MPCSANPAGPSLLASDGGHAPSPMILDLFRFQVDVLEIAVIDALFAQAGEQDNSQSGVEVAKCRGAVAVFEHHALHETSCRVIVTEARERLDRVEIEFFFCDDLLERQIETY